MLGSLPPALIGPAFLVHMIDGFLQPTRTTHAKDLSGILVGKDGTKMAHLLILVQYAIGHPTVEVRDAHSMPFQEFNPPLVHKLAISAEAMLIEIGG